MASVVNGWREAILAGMAAKDVSLECFASWEVFCNKMESGDYVTEVGVDVMACMLRVNFRCWSNGGYVFVLMRFKNYMIQF